MSTAILYFFRYNDREGILPVNTYVSTQNAHNHLEEIQLYLTDILKKFVKEKIVDSFFWIEDKTGFNPDETEGYGYVYDEQVADDNLQLPDDAYQAAVFIAKNLVSSKVWKQEIEEDTKYTLTGYSVNDIPDVGPGLNYDVPVDPRYNLGDVLVGKNGKTLTYAGAHHNPLRPYTSKQSEIVNTKGQPSYYGQKVLVGVECNDYVKEEAILDYLKNGNIEVYPLPSVATRNLAKGMKWFARDAVNTNLEGYGKTQKEAKNQLAIKVAFN
jgi:hypothetical protein